MPFIESTGFPLGRIRLTVEYYVKWVIDCNALLDKNIHCPLAFQFRTYIFMYLGYLFFNLDVIAKHEISVKLYFP